MDNIVKYYLFFFLFTILSLNVHSQFLCDNEYQVINKQKKAIKKHAEFQVKESYIKNPSKLMSPSVLKFSKIQIKTEEKDFDELKK